MTTDEWTNRPANETDSTADQPETSTDEAAPYADLDLSEPEDQPPARTDASTPTAPEPDRKAGFPSRPKTMAILSYMSVLFGLPVFLVPLIQRKHPLSLHHAKAAGLISFVFYTLLGLSAFATGLFLPLTMLAYLPALVGIYRAVQGREAGKWGLGDLAERLFPYPKVRQS